MVPEWTGNLDQSIDQPVVAMLLSSIKVVLESGLAIGAITATLMNLMLPMTPSNIKPSAKNESR